MRDTLRNHLNYHWWIYVISIILVFVLWISVFNKLNQPLANEQINITYIGSNFENKALEDDLYTLFNELDELEIKRITIERAIVDGDYELNTILRARMAGNTDLFIIESSIIEKYQIDFGSFFPVLNQDSLVEYFNTTNYQIKDEKVYGILCEKLMNINKYYRGEHSVSIFMNKNSVNLSDMFGGDKDQNAAIIACKYLTEVQYEK